MFTLYRNDVALKEGKFTTLVDLVRDATDKKCVYKIRDKKRNVLVVGVKNKKTNAWNIMYKDRDTLQLLLGRHK